MYGNPGVLTRCLASLEQKDLDSSRSTGTSDALKEVIVAYEVVQILWFAPWIPWSDSGYGKRFFYKCQ